MLAPVVVLLLMQAGPMTMAAPPFAVSGVDAVVGRAWEQRFVSRLQSPKLKVTSARDIEQVLGLERQRQLLGCESNSVCLAELAGALGVELVLSASIVKSDSGFLATIKVIRTRDGQGVVEASERHRTESELLDWLDATAVSMRDTLTGEVASAPPRWLPAVVGAALLAASGVSFTIAGINYSALTATMLPTGATGTSVHQLRVDGETAQWLGVGFAAGGGVAVLWSVVWMALAPKTVATVQPVVSWNGQSGVLGVQGVWP